MIDFGPYRQGVTALVDVAVGRSRYELAWLTVRTAAELRARIEESRRMRLSMLHDDSHRGQIQSIVAQARAARTR
ncbi:MAG: hypothetical protein QOK05_2895 [Chloroflexota bacterium]|jgi:hypothetical protein|nr:hypothetical protein [Chloroflexota bacterium]